MWSQQICIIHQIYDTLKILTSVYNILLGEAFASSFFTNMIYLLQLKLRKNRLALYNLNSLSLLLPPL